MGKYFGTDGVRGNATTYLTRELAYRIGRYIGQYPNGKRNKILIGRDTRISGSSLDEALVEGLLKSGAIVYDLGVTTTPSVSYLVETKHFDYGVMISASHNPFTDNGIKLFAPSGEKLSNDIELLIEDYIDSDSDYLPIKDINNADFHDSHDMLDEYLAFAASKCKLENKTYKILLDCAHGSACVAAEKLFKDLLHQDVTIMNDTFDGKDINLNCGSTHLEMIKSEIVKGNYDVGFAFDGDADRLMTITPTGDVIDGDFLIFLAAKIMHEQGVLHGDKVVITTMSNLGLKKSLQKYGLGYEEVDVGDKYVQARLKEKDLSIGGEQSGHVIFYQDLNTGCGLLSAVHVLNIMQHENKPLDELKALMKSYPQLLINVPVVDKVLLMKNPELLSVIKKVSDELGDDGRILVRPSGTEQLIRVMVEASSKDECAKYCNRVVDYIKSIN